MTVTCLAFSGVIAEDGLDTQELSVGPTAPIAGKADADLSGAPAGSTKIAAFDLTITATADMAGGGAALAVAVGVLYHDGRADVAHDPVLRVIDESLANFRRNLRAESREAVGSSARTKAGL